MDPMAYSRCMECDSENLFMDGSRCAACLSAVAVEMEETSAAPEEREVLFDPAEGIHHPVLTMRPSNQESVLERAA